jgi:hypothetical protein
MRPLFALLLAGCAISEGDFLVTLQPHGLAARLAGRSDKALTTDTGYSVRLEVLSVHSPGLALSYTQRDPPAGGTLLLRLSDAVPVAIRATPLPAVAFSGCTPRCGLEEGRLAEGQLQLTRVRLEGLVRDATRAARLPDDTPLRVDLSPSPPLMLRQRLDLPLSRSTPARLQAGALLELPLGLLDGIDWADPVPGRREARLAENLARSGLTVELTEPAE